MALTTKFYSAGPTIDTSFSSYNSWVLQGSYGVAPSVTFSQGTFSSSYYSLLYTVPSGRTAKINLAPLMSVGWSPYISAYHYYLMSISWGGGGTTSWSAGAWMSNWHSGNVTFYINGALIYQNGFFASHSTAYASSMASSGARYSVYGGTQYAAASSSATSSIISSEMIHYLGPGQSVDMRWQYNGYAFLSMGIGWQGGQSASMEFSVYNSINWAERGSPIKFNLITIEEAGS